MNDTMTAEMQEKRPVIMKLNIPFCSRKCSFCSRNVWQGRDTGVLQSYVMALATEIKVNADEFKDCIVKAVHIGGGCASMINGKDTENLLRLIKALYNTVDDLPVSMRCSPADINGANMPFYNRAHITRYDLELFSLEPDDFIHLDYLNYMEQLPYISAGFLRAKQRPSMGSVLLCGKKTRSRWGFRRSLLETVRRDFVHVTLQRCTGRDAMDDAECEAEFAEAKQVLEENGFAEYLPQKYAKLGCEDAYLAERAAGTDELGFGLGAVTSFESLVTKNTLELEKYLHYSGDYAIITESAEEK